MDIEKLKDEHAFCRLCGENMAAVDEVIGYSPKTGKPFVQCNWECPNYIPHPYAKLHDHFPGGLDKPA